MTTRAGELRTCDGGHEYYRISDCPTCPTCEEERKPEDGLLSRLGGPARSALEHEGITTVTELSKYTESEILELHGVGPSSIPSLRRALEESGLDFRSE